MLEARPKRRGTRRSTHRGNPILRAAFRKWGLYALYLTAASLLLAGGVVVYKARPVDDFNKVLISVGRGFVRDAIRDEFKASFGADEETRVENLPDKHFLVTGWVDVLNEQGEVARQNFSCVIHKNAADEWVGEKIAVLPQEL